MIVKIVAQLLTYISNWNKFWFGLIFLGSIFNEALKGFNLLDDSPCIWILSFGLGALIGLIAKIRGAWL